MADKFTAKMTRWVNRLDPQFQEQGQRDLRALQEAGVDSYEDLTTVVQGDDKHLRLIACYFLGKLGYKKSAFLLRTLLQDSDAEVRCQAALSLGDLGSKPAVPSLILTMSQDPDDETQAMAAHALGLLDDLRAVKPLTAILVSPHEKPGLRGEAAEALGNLEAREAVPALISALSDNDPKVRYWAVFALGQIGDPQALLPLQDLAATDDAVLANLGALKDEAIDAIHQIQDRL